MKPKNIFTRLAATVLFPALALAFVAHMAVADPYDWANKSVNEFPTTTTAPATADKQCLWVAADNKVECFGATVQKLTGSFNGTVGATTPAAGVFTTIVGNSLAVNSATISANGVYLPAANTVGLSARSLLAASFTEPASGVNAWIGTGSATGNLTTLAVGGSGADATAPALFGGNSTGKVYVGGTTAANSPLQVVPVASGVNQLIVNGTATGTSPSIVAGGASADATLNILIQPKGASSTIFGVAGTANGGITLSGSTSGTTIVNPAAVASGTLTLPAITGNVVAKGVPVACGSTCTLGAANKNTVTRLDTAAGSAATLPNATGTGDTYTMYISVANSSNQDKVLLNTVTDTIIGTAQGENAGTAKVFVGNAGTYHSIQMPFAGTQPSGGFIGDTITCTDVASTIWKCDIQYQAGTTPTTPYNAGTT